MYKAQDSSCELKYNTAYYLDCIDSGCLLCGGDLNQRCCGGTCYNIKTHNCCPGVTKNYICNLYEKCCYGSCCDPNQCEDCNKTSGACESRCKPEMCQECDGNGNCISKCDPANCETCVDGECVSSCDSADCEECDGSGNCVVCDGNPTKCCINGECVDKCEGDGECCPEGLSCCGTQCYDPSTQ
ncbi:MAG: hypothetical protein PHQ35_11385, partial [Phycisphaerae bacterium]|nr:hypothetical protein [Phycisphaerae bacterium]